MFHRRTTKGDAYHPPFSFHKALVSQALFLRVGLVGMAGDELVIICDELIYHLIASADGGRYICTHFFELLYYLDVLKLVTSDTFMSTLWVRLFLWPPKSRFLLSKIDEVSGVLVVLPDPF